MSSIVDWVIGPEPYVVYASRALRVALVTHGWQQHLREDITFGTEPMRRVSKTWLDMLRRGNTAEVEDQIEFGRLLKMYPQEERTSYRRYWPEAWSISDE